MTCQKLGYEPGTEKYNQDADINKYINVCTIPHAKKENRY